MDSALRLKILTIVESLHGEEFQEFGELLLTKRYGLSFQVVRSHRDQGCDGILNDSTVIAMYGPENNRLSIDTFRRKVGSDHAKYLLNWAAMYSDFMFFYNSEFTAQMIQIMDSISPRIHKIDINKIIELIDELSYPEMFEIVTYLRIPEDFFSFDIFSTVVSDLSSASRDRIRIERARPTYIIEKIKLNYDDEDIQSAKEEYEFNLSNIGMLEQVLKTYDSDVISALKSKIIRSYGELTGTFKERLSSLTERLCERRPLDDMYKFYTRVVLLYMFEICLIGRRN